MSVERLLLWQPSGKFLYSSVIIFICFMLCWKLKYDDDDDFFRMTEWPDYLSALLHVKYLHIASHIRIKNFHWKRLQTQSMLSHTGEFLLVIGNPWRSSDDRHAAEVSIAEPESQWDDNWPRLVGQYRTAAWSGTEHHQRNEQ